MGMTPNQKRREQWAQMFESLARNSGVKRIGQVAQELRATNRRIEKRKGKTMVQR